MRELAPEQLRRAERMGVVRLGFLRRDLERENAEVLERERVLAGVGIAEKCVGMREYEAAIPELGQLLGTD